MSDKIERPAAVTDDHLEYLDDLRDSGVTNMFGAGAYISDEFGETRNVANKILSYWMESFDERHPRGEES
jgi:hypothetical protein